MKYLIAAILASTLAGCTTVPVTMTFPDMPAELRKPCPDLEKTPKTDKLSDVVGVVTKNYSKYHECKDKVESINSWYDTQKKIYESVK